MAGKCLQKALPKYRTRYQAANREERSKLLGATGYHRKYAIALLGNPADTPTAQPRKGRNKQ